MSGITSHILDTSRGRPAAGLVVRLQQAAGASVFREVAQGITNADGRVTNLVGQGAPEVGVYRLCFATGPYFRAQGVQSFYPEVVVVFELSEPTQHYHVPLLLSPFGYSTYRGS